MGYHYLRPQIDVCHYLRLQLDGCHYLRYQLDGCHYLQPQLDGCKMEAMPLALLGGCYCDGCYRLLNIFSDSRQGCINIKSPRIGAHECFSCVCSGSAVDGTAHAERRDRRRRGNTQPSGTSRRDIDCSQIHVVRKLITGAGEVHPHTTYALYSYCSVAR